MALRCSSSFAPAFFRSRFWGSSFRRFHSTLPSVQSFSFTESEVRNRHENAALLNLVEAFRRHGHLSSSINPLQEQPSTHSLLLPSSHGFTPAELEKKYNVSGILNMDAKEASFSEIWEKLYTSYCGDTGYEFFHCDPLEQQWWANEAETPESTTTDEEKKRILSLIVNSEEFDKFLARKYSSVKRYGLEGNESMLPALDTLFGSAARNGVQNVVIGMPHRGRLNLLVELLGVSAAKVFAKITGAREIPDLANASGDVLSHLHANSQLVYGKDHLHVSLLHNPSHLEAVNPVAMGKTRSKQARYVKLQRKRITDLDAAKSALCILLHGDASVSGQGVVAEAFTLSNPDGFNIGGTIHIVVNNQLGFTAEPHESRSSRYCSDIAKVIEAPVIHVNSDNPDAVARACKLALKYRQEFHKDVIVDMIGYRRWGHNEMDEPSFTQPLLYSAIRNRATVASTYAAELASRNIVTDEEVNAMREASNKRLNQAAESLDDYTPYTDYLGGPWKTLKHPDNITEPISTGKGLSILRDIAEASVYHGSVALHPRLKKLFCAARIEKAQAGHGIDWATAEALAFGTLLTEGYNVRLSGQDVARGTFSHRHLVFKDVSLGEAFYPFDNLPPNLFEPTKWPGRLEVANSPLSEFAVLGFEYGYSIDDPHTLVIWEAQFGDFANGAQVIIDQFISSSQDKWLRQCGLVLLLPHGYDGAGPEHSSCRPERFLQLCNGEAVNVDQVQTTSNLIIINPTTPAQYFHALRRQMLAPYRVPLVVIAPKTVLRLPEATSTLQDMSIGTNFLPVLADSMKISNPKRIVFCSGKIYYQLIKEREERKVSDVMFVRLEQLAPFPLQEILEVLPTAKGVRYFWCQEEPQNMGYWNYVSPRLLHVCKKVDYIGRKPYSASSTGFSDVHQAEIRDILDQVFEA